VSGLPQGFVAAAGALAATVINAIWQDALLVVCVWLLLRLWPRINAATRYTVWSATLLAAILVPIATTLPFLTATQSAPAHFEVTAARQSAPSRVHAEPPTRAHAAAQGPVSSERPPLLPERLRITVPPVFGLVIFVAWALLAVYALARLIIGLTRLEQLKRDAMPLPINYRDSMSQWGRANKGARDVRLCVSDETDVPVAVGLFDAMILIPRALLDHLSQAEIDQISLHELAHLRRADDWTNSLQRVIIALLGWNPAAQFVGQQLDLEREVACDDWVLSFVGAVRPYALCLTKMAETAAWPRHPIPAPGVFATRKHISLRIERLLGAGRNVATSLSLGPAAAALAVVGALSFAIAIVAPSVAMPLTPSVASSPLASTPVARASSIKPAKPKEIVRYVRVAVAPTAAASAPARVTNTASPTVAHIPAIHVHVPQQVIRTPGTDVEVPGHSFTIPSPQIDASRLSGGVTTSIGEAFSVSKHAEEEAAKSIGAVAGAGADGENRQVAQNERSCTSCDFSRVNWAGRDMRGVTYNGADFTEANLAGTNFSGGSFTGTDFSRANLHDASFRDANLSGCDFTEANLTGVDFTGARLSGCRFSRAQLAGAQLRNVLDACKGCDFSHADLSGVDLGGVRANGDDFSRANLRNVNFAGAELVGIDFSGANLDGANLAGATLNACDLSGVDLAHVDLSRTRLIGIDFSRRRSSPPPR
jgi:uncharacterized protein YjbI with pentapeptide repeats/beta-lactamase regulating signal transducer with metallopeptidase domain